MSRIFLLLTILTSIVFTADSYSRQELVNSEELANVLIQGNRVSAVLEFPKCNSTSHTHPNARLGGLFNLYIDKQSSPVSAIAISTTIYVFDDHCELVNNYIRLRIYENNISLLYNLIFDPVSMNPIESSETVCIFRNGLNLYIDKIGLFSF
jgi:hypothetical protein